VTAEEPCRTEPGVAAEALLICEVSVVAATRGVLFWLPCLDKQEPMTTLFEE
jgi:hypothetical protein